MTMKSKLCVLLLLCVSACGPVDASDNAEVETPADNEDALIRRTYEKTVGVSTLNYPILNAPAAMTNTPHGIALPGELAMSGLRVKVSRSTPVFMDFSGVTAMSTAGDPAVSASSVYRQTDWRFLTPMNTWRRDANGNATLYFTSEKGYIIAVTVQIEGINASFSVRATGIYWVGWPARCDSAGLNCRY
jgi:hypothetical protein